MNKSLVSFVIALAVAAGAAQPQGANQYNDSIPKLRRDAAEQVAMLSIGDMMKVLKHMVGLLFQQLEV